MRSKSLGILVRTLLFGMFLSIPSSVHAEAFALTVVNFSNIQLTTTAGNITFGVWQASAFSAASNTLGAPNEQTNASTSNGGLAVATTTVTFANATGVADGMNVSVHASSAVDVLDCICAASSTGRGTLFNTFTVTGVDGPVNVNISGFLDSLQILSTDQFGVVAQSQIVLALFVDSIAVFSMEFPRTIGASSMDTFLTIQQLADAITVQANTQHTVSISIRADASGVDAVPEPTTAVLLLSGLGFMTGLIKKRRQVLRR